MRHALVHEPLSDVAARGAVGGHRLRESRFLFPAGRAVREQVIRIARAHYAGASQRQGHAGSVDSDPASPRLFGNVSHGPRATGRVQHKVAGISGHQNATLNYLRHCLDYVCLLQSVLCVQPNIRHRVTWEVIYEPLVVDILAKPTKRLDLARRLIPDM